MIDLGWWKLGAVALAGAMLAAMLAGAYRHYTGLVSQVSTLTADKATLQLALDTEKATAEGLKKGIQAWNDAYELLRKQEAESARVAMAASAEARRLNELLGSHDLGALARSRPGLVEARLNAGTARAGRLLECATTPGGCPPDGDPAPGGVPRAAPGARPGPAR